MGWDDTCDKALNRAPRAQAESESDSAKLELFGDAMRCKASKRTAPTFAANLGLLLLLF
jgi:hypothetical protein